MSVFSASQMHKNNGTAWIHVLPKSYSWMNRRIIIICSTPLGSSAKKSVNQSRLLRNNDFSSDSVLTVSVSTVGSDSVDSSTTGRSPRSGNAVTFTSSTDVDSMVVGFGVVSVVVVTVGDARIREKLGLRQLARIGDRTTFTGSKSEDTSSARRICKETDNHNKINQRAPTRVSM